MDLDAEFASFEAELAQLETTPATTTTSTTTANTEATTSDVSHVDHPAAASSKPAITVEPRPKENTAKDPARKVYFSAPQLLMPEDKSKMLVGPLEISSPKTIAAMPKLINPSIPSMGAAASANIAAGSASSLPGPSNVQLSKKSKFVRGAGGEVWEDPSLAEWPDDLGNECDDLTLARAFQKYSSYLRSKVVRDRRTNKTKGFGFVSFSNADDMSRAIKEMDGRYIGNRPVKIRRSSWDDRNLSVNQSKKMKRSSKHMF